MNLRDRLGPGVRSVESFRESMGVPRPASVREMLTREIALRFVGFHCFGETDETLRVRRALLYVWGAARCHRTKRPGADGDP